MDDRTVIEQLRAAVPADVQATYCATLVDQWARMGMAHAVVAPGSRSTPMALALAAHPGLAIHVAIDERTAAFMALGIGIETGLPAALLCTSGTAATHFHAAVVEADLSDVPMLVLTADRPPELHGVGAPQTIDQFELYGDAVRVFASAEVPDAASAHEWRALASELWWATQGDDGGPVHLNLPFREPLVGTALELPPALELDDHDSAVDDEWIASPIPFGELLSLMSGRPGLIVAGRGVHKTAAVGRLADAFGWPVLADPRSGCRTLPGAVVAFDPVVRVRAFVEAHRPEIVLHLGEQPASKVLGQWMAECAEEGTLHVHVHASQRIIDPAQIVSHRVYGEPGSVCESLLAEGDVEAADPAWRDAWLNAGEAAQGALGAALENPDAVLSEPMVARKLSDSPGTTLVVSSSMPVRDIEWFGRPSSMRVVSHRGANGIDGVLASAIGVAVASSSPTVALLGDVAFCHDASSLTGLATRRLDLTVVVIDNDGGGIFSFLPQRSVLEADRFEQLFGTPHGTDVVALARAHGLGARTVTTLRELGDALTDRECTVVRVASERDRNVADHGALNAAVAAAVVARAR